MAYTDIDKPSDYFNTKLFTGNGSSGHAISGVGFQSDWTWIKNRSAGNSNHRITDAVRGVTKEIYSDLTAAEATNTNGLTAFGSDGFTVGSNGDYNNNGSAIVSWNWKANGAGSANTDGDIASTVSVNTTSGFSIVSYTGNGSAGATVGHGLGSLCKFIIIKRLNSTNDWEIGSTALGWDKHLYFNTGAANTSSNRWQSTAPTNSVFYLGPAAGNNASSSPLIAYCFSEKQGYSKFGSYVGNGNADGTFVYTGFSPAFVMVKRTNGANSWNIKDNRRNNASTSFNINPRNATLLPNDSAADQDANALDFLSNGFKNRSTGNDVNNASGSYIYMAFAENPFTSSTGTPVTAR